MTAEMETACSKRGEGETSIMQMDVKRKLELAGLISDLKTKDKREEKKGTVS